MTTNKNKVKQALHHHRMDEDKKAIDILEAVELAEDGAAQLLLGQIYFRAHKAQTGVSRSYPKARQYYLKALELGNSEAACELADMYYFAYGVKENYKKAESYWKQGAEMGNEMAQFELGNFYYDHQREDIDEAIRLFKILIDRNEFVENSYLKLARIYYRGLGVEKDIEEALHWYQKGVEVVHGNSCMDLAYIYYKGEDVEKDVEKAISLAELAGTTEWLKDDAPEIIEKMRNGTLFRPSDNEAIDDLNEFHAEDFDDEDFDDYDDIADVKRTAQDIARRALCLSAVVSCGFGDDKNNVCAWLKKENLWNYVSPEERNFLSRQSTEKDSRKFTWQIEALVPLLWVISKIDKMPGIDKQCDTEPLKEAVIWSPNTTREYIATAVLRDKDEISKEYEKVYDAHWTVRDAQLNNKPVPKKYDAEVIFERHYGFNWATGYMGQDWDDISTDT